MNSIVNLKTGLPHQLTELTEGVSISEKGLPTLLTKLTKGASVSFVSAMGTRICKNIVDGLRGKNYSDYSVLKTPRTAAMSPRKSVAFFTSIGFAPMGGSAANKRPFGGICPPPVCGFELLPTCLKSRFPSHIQEQNHG